MVTIFNRRELASTQNAGKQAAWRQTLRQNGIEVYVRVQNRQSPSPFSAGTRARSGSLGGALDYAYTLFVKKEDYEQAAFLLQNSPLGK